MTTIGLANRSVARPAPTLACQRVGGWNSRAILTGAAVVGLLVAACLLCVWSRTEEYRHGYALSEEAEKIRDMAEQQERLRAEVAALRSPERVESIARQKLGMSYPGPDQIRIVAGQAVEDERPTTIAATGTR